MGFLIWIVVGSTILSVDDCEDFFSRVFVSIIYFSIFAAIALFIKSDVIYTWKLEKVYTIRDSDTTYKWTYHEKN
jgi:hypothetical protein